MPSFVYRLKQLILGRAKNPLNPETQRHIALVAFLAWIGLGADGLSSSCYGPEQAFLALGSHIHLAFYVSLATILTVFIISLAYNQVIELFPSGGGGYKVATQLISPFAGLVSGTALMIDYMLTITTSIASCADAFFSLLPMGWLHLKLLIEILLVFTLMILNLRGMKESIKILMPIFLGFMLIHSLLIIGGIYVHRVQLTHLFSHYTSHPTIELINSSGGWFVAALLLRSYSLGGGTYTGLEAVSNNINQLAEPRVRTGKWTMFYMATSLSFIAGGIMLLYLLWNATPVFGQTLNASVFAKILGPSELGHIALTLILIFEAGLLLVGANTGFLAGPSLLGNMAIDHWVPNRFQHLSSRLVTQNGVLFFGLATLIILILTQGNVALLVVLYSINVFLTFSLSLLGLCIYWARHRTKASQYWIARLSFSIFSLSLTLSILFVTIFIKWKSGAWLTLLVTGLVASICLLIKRDYMQTQRKLQKLAQICLPKLQDLPQPKLCPNEPTAIIFVNKHLGPSISVLTRITQLFPKYFKNIIFLSVGVVDVESFNGQDSLRAMQNELDKNLNFLIQYAQHLGYAAEANSAYGTDPITHLMRLAAKTQERFPHHTFFAASLVFKQDSWLKHLLYNKTALNLQRHLHIKNEPLIILPVPIE